MTIIKGKTLLAVSAGVAIAVLSSSGVRADNAVFINSIGGNSLASNGDTIAVSSSFGAANDGFSGDPTNAYSARGFVGSWYTFSTQNVLDIAVNVTAQAWSGSFSPGLTVWASGANEFDGGDMSIGAEMSSVPPPFFTPNSFNATGNIGASGTLWMANGVGGNLIETLGYAVSGPGVTEPTGWGESILHGAHDVSATDTFESGVYGSTSGADLWGPDVFGFPASTLSGDRFAELAFNNLQPGWYAVFVGGTDTTQTGGFYDLTISVVPEMETWFMMLAGMGFLAWRMRKQQRAMMGFSA
ncbi:pyruvate-binding protein [Pseudomonadota bacterium]